MRGTGRGRAAGAPAVPLAAMRPSDVLLEAGWLGPDLDHILFLILVLLGAGTPLIARFRAAPADGDRDRRPSMLRGLGVPLTRVKRALRELERKTFHLCGLLVPLVHLALLERGVAPGDCARLCWGVTALGWTADVARVNSAAVRRRWPLASILREHEATQLTGGCYFSLGCTLAISLAPPSVAACSILFLVLGDMAAALVGVSFGGEVVSQVKLGRRGKKSLEGSLAMFAVCFAVGCAVFAAVPLREYAVFLAAAAATLTELYEPFCLNDNLTIPVFSALALQIGLNRIRCPACA